MRLLFACFIFFHAIGIAQEYSKKELKNHSSIVKKSKSENTVIVSLDTLYFAGNPISLFKQNIDVDSEIGYSVLSFDKAELIEIKFYCKLNENDTAVKDCVWIFHFIESKSKGEVKGINEQDLPEFIVKNNLISNNQIDKENEKKFLLNNPQKVSAPAVPMMSIQIVYDEEQFKMVERDRAESIYVVGEIIMQDSVEIGYFKYEILELPEQTETKVLVYLKSGILTATAVLKVESENFYQIYTEKEQRLYHVEVHPDKRIEHIAMFLVQRKCL